MIAAQNQCFSAEKESIHNIWDEWNRRKRFALCPINEIYWIPNETENDADIRL